MELLKRLWYILEVVAGFALAGGVVFGYNHFDTENNLLQAIIVSVAMISFALDELIKLLDTCKK